jgi:hypothetical protein
MSLLALVCVKHTWQCVKHGYLRVGCPLFFLSRPTCVDRATLLDHRRYLRVHILLYLGHLDVGKPTPHSPRPSLHCPLNFSSLTLTRGHHYHLYQPQLRETNWMNSQHQSLENSSGHSELNSSQQTMSDGTPACSPMRTGKEIRREKNRQYMQI